MSADVAKIVNSLQEAVKALNRLNETLGGIFPQTGQTSPTASIGSGTLPGDPEDFLVITLPNGEIRKIPLFLE